MDKQLIGKQIIQLRKENNMQQKELAEKLCVSASAVSKWESGINLPDTATLLKLAEIFQISENVFLHPEVTPCRHLSCENTTPPGVYVDNRTSPQSIPQKLLPKLGYVCALILLCMLIATSVGIYLYHNPSFKVVTSRYVEYKEHGLVFELSIVCPSYTTQDAIHEYADHIFDEWIDGTIASDADSVRMEFYTDAEAASRWTFDTISSITLVK